MELFGELISQGRVLPQTKREKVGMTTALIAFFISLPTLPTFNILLRELESSFVTYDTFLLLYIPFVKTEPSNRFS